MKQHWRDVAFLHWPVDSELVASMIHPELEPDTLLGSAWAGLVPFRMVGIGPAGGPAVPYLGTFPETNVRTYVVGPDGPGVWFHSLEASRWLPVAVARLAYRLPYFHAAMRFDDDGGVKSYNTIRRWPGPKGVGGSVRVRVEDELVEPSNIDVFLTARWRLYTSMRGRLYSAEVRHPAWPLRRATALHWDQELIHEAGYPNSTDEPQVLYSAGVPVDVFRPTRTDRSVKVS